MSCSARRLLQELPRLLALSEPETENLPVPRQGPASSQRRSPPLHQSVWDAVHQAAGRAGLDKRVHPHTLRHCFCYPLTPNPAPRPAHYSTPARPCRSEDNQPLPAPVGAASQRSLLPAPSIHSRWRQPHSESERRSPQEVNEPATPGVGRYYSRHRSPIHGPGPAWFTWLHLKVLVAIQGAAPPPWAAI